MHVNMVTVTTQKQPGSRRKDALSKERIVDAAIAILDTDGESALTFRALAARLATGAGAIYWHVTDKNELLTAATTDVVSHAVHYAAGDAEPRQAVRNTALAVFDAIDAHPWAGTQLSRDPSQVAMLQILDRIGQGVHALGVPQPAQFDAASALLNYVIGVAGQNAANARLLPRHTDRSTFLSTIATQWSQYDPAEYPFVHRVAAQLPEHDDREQFLYGIDLILTGLMSLDS